MTQLLILREHIQKMYQRYSSFFQVVMRFMVGFGLFFAINRVLGYRPILSHGYVNVIMGVISVIFPLEAMIFLVALFIVLQVMYVSKMLAFCIGVIFLILYLLYIQFIPKHEYVLIAVPLAYSVGLSAGAPVLLGLLFGPAGVLPGVIGVLLYYLFRNLITVASSATTDSFDLFQVLIDQLVEDEELFAAIAVFVVVMLVVYMIRSLRVDFSFEAAIIIGIVSDIILCLFANYLQLMKLHMIPFFAGAVISLGLVWLIQFFRLSLNYAGVENLQFEDEEYYYYVRAVPKNSIATKSKRIKRFNAHLFTDRNELLAAEMEDNEAVPDGGNRENKEDS